MALYGELHAHSGFSFLDGASDPEELAAEASALGGELFGVTRPVEEAETRMGVELSVERHQS